MIRRFKMWRLNRRIDRMLRESGFPMDFRNVFTGNVRVEETAYDDDV